ncbi:MAG: SMC-Scp complex subunit ScpB [Deltaproteobacteria bacterium]|nr:SMC-Scp complex subunit ScpB [Deltaproteobacteria bacterium]
MADDDAIRTSLEALIFAAAGPATVAQLRRALPRLAPAEIGEHVKQINEELVRDGRPYEIVEAAGGYRFRTRPEFGDLILSAQPERRTRLSRPALETVSVIAYRQPITRAEIEELRCVDCGAVLKSLLDRHLIRIVGRRDAPGRPVLYGTSANFLETFGLKSLRDLPELREIVDLYEEHGTPIAEAEAEEDSADDLEPDEEGPVDVEAGARPEIELGADPADGAAAGGDPRVEEGGGGEEAEAPKA